MAENLLNRVLNDEIDPANLLEWLTKLNYQDPKFAELSAQFRCSRTEFVTFFLNFVHEEIGSGISEKRIEQEDTKSSSEINRSHSFPLDLSSELDTTSLSNSTPKITKVNSDSSVLSYMSPISPIYKQQESFTTPKGHRICLGDFIVKRVSSKKKSETKRRIKPTNLVQQNVNSFHKSENSFNFSRSEQDFSGERNVLLEERLKIATRNDIQNVTGSPKKISRSFSGEVKCELESVTHREQIERLVRIYGGLLDNSFVLNLTSEVYFLISLLLKKQYYNLDWGIEILTEKITASALFTTIHNIVYFASRCLETMLEILVNYDNSTIRLLAENQRLLEFAPTLVSNLQKVSKPDRIIEIEPLRDNICFNSDTDNRQNFPNDPSFHAFRKQRDLFYEIFRIWEQHHLAPGFNYVMSLGGKIRTLLNLSNEPTNFIHFSRLFKAQLLSTCRNGDCGDFVTSLDVDAQKLSKLKSRCVTKGNCQGLNSLPRFNEGEEFYKDFILVGASQVFNRHLADALVWEITELNESSFGELDGKENDVDLTTKKSYYLCIKSLRILAKFLGFIESLPYKTECTYSDQLLTTHLKIRQQIRPNFDVKTLLQHSIGHRSVILCVPWVTKYLSMLDHVTLKLPYYTEVCTDLFWIYRNFDWGPQPNIYLVKFCLGWLFELPHLPDNNYLHFCSQSSPKTLNGAPSTSLDQLEIVDQDIIYLCCPYLDEIKKLLSTTLTSHSITIKHITPVTALQSPDDVARKRLEQQLEEAFFNGQPISLRKTVEFVSERVASTCVKYVCGTLVPSHKKTALEKLKSALENDDPDKVALKTKASQLAAICLKELQDDCDREIGTISECRIRKCVDSLVSLDILPQTRDVCVGITRKTCLERVRQWVGAHVTLGLFTKDFNDEIQRSAAGDGKRAKKPLFMLPSGGSNPQHDDRTISAAGLVEKFRASSVQVIERNPLPDGAFVALLDDTAKSIARRGDVNQCVVASLCTQLLDLVLLLLAHDRRVLSQDGVMSKCCHIWKLYYNGCEDLFKSLLCPRNVMILGQSNDRRASWDAFANFCAYLVKNKMLSCNNFESQCTGFFKIDWDQETLKCVTDFFKTFVGLFRGGNTSEFTFLIDFLADYCDNLF